MHSEHYPHPEFGWLSPTPRLRRVGVIMGWLAALAGLIDFLGDRLMPPSFTEVM
jgi:hypothetical protein